MATRGTRHRGWWFCFLLVLCTGAIPAARQYRTIEGESLRVLVESDWVPRAAPGYLPIRFDLTNLGDAREIEIVVQVTRFFRTSPSGAAQSSVRHVVRLEPKARVRLTMPVPVFADNENLWIEIREDNRRLEGFSSAGLQSRLAPANASTLIIADPATSLGEMAALGRAMAAVATVGSGSSGTTMVVRGTPGSSSYAVSASGARTPVLDVRFDPARLPTNWLAFTSVRAVVVGRDEWGLLDEPQKNALLTWTACGGNLIFVDGALDTLLPGARSEPTADPGRMIRRHLLGRIHVVTSKALETTGLAGLLLTVEESRDLVAALPANSAVDWGAIEGRGFRLSIPGINGVPARTFLAILLLFSVVIGPASYWFLRRHRQLVLHVLTAPLISLVSIALLVGYALADEGFRVQGRAVTFTVLDQVKKQSATRATVSLYAPGLSPTAGLRFSRDVAVFPIGVDGSGSRERIALDLTDAQVFTNGLLATRAPTNFEQIAFRPARERLTFSRNGAGLTVTNGLDASVVGLRYREGDTIYTVDGPLPSGGQQTMKPVGAAAPNLTLPAKFLPLVDHQPAGSYLALLDRSPFWEPGTPGVLEHGSVHVVLGWPEGQR